MKYVYLVIREIDYAGFDILYCTDDWVIAKQVKEKIITSDMFRRYHFDGIDIIKLKINEAPSTMLFSEEVEEIVKKVRSE